MSINLRVPPLKVEKRAKMKPISASKIEINTFMNLDLHNFSRIKRVKKKALRPDDRPYDLCSMS